MVLTHTQVVIGGSEAATNDLVAYAQGQLKTARAILAPKVGEDVDVTSDTSVYPVRCGG